MKNSFKKVFSVISALLMLFVLIIPMSASAGEDPFIVTLQPVSAVYNLNDVAVPLTATFKYSALDGNGTINYQSPIKVQWYWSYENSNADRINGLGETTVDYDRQIVYTATTIPATDEVGIKYYYAVITYGKDSMKVTGQPEILPAVAASAPAKIEVVATNDDRRIEVKKVDEEGFPLADALIALTPENDYRDGNFSNSIFASTDKDGMAYFPIPADGEYIISESRAPEGYNATDVIYFILVSPNGVFLTIPTRTVEYKMVTFINKKIPTLNRDDHFAFMQGYPDVTFRQEKNMTRAEAVVMFSRLLTETMDVDTDYRNDYYPDFPDTAWFANQVGFMQSKGVLADYSRDENFRPNDPVTRAEFATLAAHFDNLTLSDENNFTDVADSYWASKYINSSAAKGWIKGYPDGTFRPEANITRAEVVTLVGRMLDRAADKEYLKTNKSILPRIYTDLPENHWAYLAIMEASTGHDYTKDGDGEHWTGVYK